MNPFLSIVLAASNADYEGNFLQRLQNMVDNTLGMIDKFRIRAELIIVEWNPPSDKSRLKDAIDWHQGYTTTPIRVIMVPKEIHDKIPNPAKWSFFEYTAKNVGIRRAKGDFILGTNADILLSESMAQQLATEDDFERGVFYRTNRYDFNESGKISHVNRADGTFSISIAVSKNNPSDMLHYNAAGDFMLMSAEDWNKLRGYKEGTGYDNTLDGRLIALAVQKGLRQVNLQRPIYHQYHTRNIRNRPEGYYDPRGWDDNNPVAEQNEDDWGFGAIDFETWSNRIPKTLIAAKSLAAVEQAKWDLNPRDICEHNLTPESTVFDVGGYFGNWSHDMFKRYGCNIVIFEPIKEYFDFLKMRFDGNDKIRIFNFGLDQMTRETQFRILGAATGAFTHSSETETVQIRDFEEVVKDYDSIDLISINIEGGEYGLMPRVIDCPKVKAVQVQFHPNIPEAIEMRNKCREWLSYEFKEIYSYPFVWEKWERR